MRAIASATVPASPTTLMSPAASSSPRSPLSDHFVVVEEKYTQGPSAVLRLRCHSDANLLIRYDASRYHAQISALACAVLPPLLYRGSGQLRMVLPCSCAVLLPSSLGAIGPAARTYGPIEEGRSSVPCSQGHQKCLDTSAPGYQVNKTSWHDGQSRGAVHALPSGPAQPRYRNREEWSTRSSGSRPLR